MPTHHDSDTGKGAVENHAPADKGRSVGQGNGLADQLPHRGTDSMIKDRDADNDTDFPEPGRVPEHSGQHE